MSMAVMFLITATVLKSGTTIVFTRNYIITTTTIIIVIAALLRSLRPRPIQQEERAAIPSPPVPAPPSRV